MAFNYITTYNKILHGPLLICKKFFFFMNVTDMWTTYVYYLINYA